MFSDRSGYNTRPRSDLDADEKQNIKTWLSLLIIVYIGAVGSLILVPHFVTTPTSTLTPTPTAQPHPTVLRGSSIHDGGGAWHGTGSTADKAFDGDISSFYDADRATGAWTGIDVGNGQSATVSSIKYYPRRDRSTRMVGGKFQGSNDLKSWNDLTSISSAPPEGRWTTVSITDRTRYRYLRYISTAGDSYCNVAEIQFIGMSNSGTPSGNPVLTGTTPTPTPTAQPHAPVLRGSSIHDEGGAWHGTGNTADKAFDGDISSFYDADRATGAWTGIDVGNGQSATVSSIKYYPRSGWSTRMVGGKFQGSNDLKSWNDLTSISSAPPEGRWTTVSITDRTRYRYLRYISTAGDSYCNIAEIQFIGDLS